MMMVGGVERAGVHAYILSSLRVHISCPSSYTVHSEDPLPPKPSAKLSRVHQCSCTCITGDDH